MALMKWVEKQNAIQQSAPKVKIPVTLQIQNPMKRSSKILNKNYIKPKLNLKKDPMNVFQL